MKNKLEMGPSIASPPTCVCGQKFDRAYYFIEGLEVGKGMYIWWCQECGSIATCFSDETLTPEGIRQPRRAWGVMSEKMANIVVKSRQPGSRNLALNAELIAKHIG